MKFPSTRPAIKIVLWVSGLAAFLVAYSVGAEKIAHTNATHFCEQTKIGSTEDEIMARALNAGSVEKYRRWVKDSNQIERSISVVFTGATSISRHICDVYSLEGKVTRHEYVYLD